MEKSARYIGCGILDAGSFKLQDVLQIGILDAGYSSL